jgi:RNA polymerase sigma-70 factor, ECF subfamily
MRPNLQFNHAVAKIVRMSVPKRAVSADAMQDEWLEIQAAQADPSCFEPLYERYYEEIFNFVYRRTVDESLTADLCSQVFLKALQNIGRYEFKGVPFSAWLYRIASNEVAQHFRRDSKQRVVSIEEAGLPEMFDEEDEHLDETRRLALVKALDKLKEEDLLLIELRFFEGRPFKEIGDILGMTENNAKVKAFRILNRMKKMMS